MVDMNLQYFGGRGSGGGKGGAGGGGKSGGSSKGLSKDSTTEEIAEAFKGTQEGSKLEVVKRDGTTEILTRKREVVEDYIDKSEGGPRIERYISDEWDTNLPNSDIVRLTKYRLQSGLWQSVRVKK